MMNRRQFAGYALALAGLRVLPAAAQELIEAEFTVTGMT